MSLTDNTKERGAGPFLFESPSIAPGESWTIDLRNVEWNGKKRGLKRYVPFDTASVTNGTSGINIRATFNGQYDASVLPNTVESFDRQGVAEVRITNPSSNTSTVSAGEVEVEVTKEPYGADDRALDKKKQHPVATAVENLTGIPLGGGD